MLKTIKNLLRSITPAKAFWRKFFTRLPFCQLIASSVCRDKGFDLFFCWSGCMGVDETAFSSRLVEDMRD